MDGASPPRDAAMHLPSRFAAVILTFAPVFLQQRTWRHAERLLIGAMLAPGKRTVASLLRIVGLNRERRFVNYHRVLSRAAWNALTAARLLLEPLIAAFAPAGPVVLGIDDTVERRRGKRASLPAGSAPDDADLGGNDRGGSGVDVVAEAVTG
jgi:SRSO17 transposase